MKAIDMIIKNTYIIIATYYIFTKIINYRQGDKKHIYGDLLAILFVALLNTMTEVYINKFISTVITCAVLNYYLSQITKNKYQYSIVITVISMIIAYFIYMPSIVIAAFFLKIIEPNIQKDNIVILLLAITIETGILYKINRIKRLKKGIAFFKDKTRVWNIGGVGSICLGFMITTYGIISNSNSREFATYLFFGIIIEIISLFIWIKKKITKYYKQKLKEQTVADLQNEIKEKDSKINEILEENKAIATINHKYSSRIKALEEFTSKITSKPELLEKMKTEFGEDYTAFEEQIKKLSKEYSNEIKTKITKENNIPKTGIFGIDALLEHMSTEATNSNIHMDIKINASINYMVEKIISESALETLLGDHIKDAIIAINSCNNTNRRILVVISIIDKCYEISFYDTGIEFEINTLIKLGKEQITTHKETGGSGIGFMTTFETLSKTKGSLIIEEKHPMNNTDYTKAIKIKFDNKNEYRIKSYRAEEIKKQRADIIIEK